jgi:hypothetical protein
VTAAVRDAPQLLDVQVDQLARMLTLVAHDDPAGPVTMGQAAHPVAAQHPVDGGAGHPQLVAEPMRALAAAPAVGPGARGTPVKWLGDGVMFYFREPAAAVLAALEMVEVVGRHGLPPAQWGSTRGRWWSRTVTTSVGR